MMENEAETMTICCNKDMELIKPYVTGMEMNEHIPEVVIKRNTAYVKVGRVLHPSESEHQIKIIALSFSDGLFVKYLSEDEKPILKVPFQKGSVLQAVYSYCNVHGCWMWTPRLEKPLKKKKG